MPPAGRCLHVWRWAVAFFLGGLSVWPVVAASLWLDNGRPTPQAHQVVQWLQGAAAEGLDPADYQADALAQALADAAWDAAFSVRWDQALTQAVQRYVTDLRQGRVPPAQVEGRYRSHAGPSNEALAQVEQSLALRPLSALVQAAAPRSPQYTQLREALAQYRALVTHPAWQMPWPPLPGRKLEPQAPWPGLPALQARLQALGDWPNGESTEPRAVHDDTLQTAVRSFQARHGLTVDGVIGPATWAALAVAPQVRVEQIALTMERLRWTPEFRGARTVVVNLPEFVLRAYEQDQGRPRLVLQMKVIVGQALDTRTPLFDEDMRYIEFSPYWNVPPSIARQETVPRLRRDPAYFLQQGFEFVTAYGQVFPQLTPEHLNAVLSGQMRIRQRPGPLNALGDIKFIFPNHDNIYLHHTPAPQLFERDRRDFSHGCIRVEAPVALAKFVLQDEPEWTEARIRAAMGLGVSTTWRLRTPVPVVLAYNTVVVQQGKVHFFNDLYGHDRRLAAALRQRSEKLRALPRPQVAQ